MHPANEIRGMKSHFLKDKRIVLAVTGSIAAVETVRLARELIRHGAIVFPVMTSAATQFIHPDALWFATGQKPIITLTGDTEHVRFCGRVKDPIDLLLIAPSTANTISKIACGIDDTVVSTFASTAIGSKRPIIIVPAMHLSMYDHNIIQKNITKLKQQGIEFIDPFIKGNKAKFASIDDIVAKVIHRIGPNKLQGKKVLVIGGSTEEPIDEIRCLSNKSSGKTAVALTKNAFFNGAKVVFYYGQGTKCPPSYMKTVRFRTLLDLKKYIDNSDIDSFDVIIVCAALTDFSIEKQKGKIDSSNDLILHCHPADKILPIIRKYASKSFIVAFKLEENKNKAIKKADGLMKATGVDAVIANTIKSIASDDQKAWIVDSSSKNKECYGSKDEVAQQILNYISSVMK